MAESTQSKSPLTSKTIIFNVITIAVALLGMDEFRALVPALTPEQIIAIVGALNVALRFVTTKPVTVFRKEF